MQRDRRGRRGPFHPRERTMSPVTSMTGRNLGVAPAFVGLEGTRLVTTNHSADQWIDPVTPRGRA